MTPPTHHTVIVWGLLWALMLVARPVAGMDCQRADAASDSSQLYKRIVNAQPSHTGAQGRIYLFDDLDSAYKVISYDNANPVIRQLILRNALSEFDVLKRLVGRPCFLQLRSCVHYVDVKMVILETERVDTDLTDELVVQGVMTEQAMMRQTATCLRELHSLNLGHNDIKPGNLAIASGQIKLIDFGLATLLGAKVDGGTMGYLPKEYIEIDVDDEGDLLLVAKKTESTVERDVYAAGITFAVLHFGYARVFVGSEADNKLWKDENLYMFQETTRTAIMDLITKRLKDGMVLPTEANVLRVIAEMLDDDPSQRASLNRVVDFLSLLDDALSKASGVAASPQLADDYWGPFRPEPQDSQVLDDDSFADWDEPSLYPEEPLTFAYKDSASGAGMGLDMFII